MNQYKLRSGARRLALNWKNPWRTLDEDQLGHKLFRVNELIAESRRKEEPDFGYLILSVIGNYDETSADRRFRRWSDFETEQASLIDVIRGSAEGKAYPRALIKLQEEAIIYDDLQLDFPVSVIIVRWYYTGYEFPTDIEKVIAVPGKG